jgi:hypothetical protein
MLPPFTIGYQILYIKYVSFCHKHEIFNVSKMFSPQNKLRMTKLNELKLV